MLRPLFTAYLIEQYITPFQYTPWQVFRQDDPGAFSLHQRQPARL